MQMICCDFKPGTYLTVAHSNIRSIKCMHSGQLKISSKKNDTDYDQRSLAAKKRLLYNESKYRIF
jgi:hypothetical protein